MANGVIRSTKLISLMLPPAVKAFYGEMQAERSRRFAQAPYQHSEHLGSDLGRQAGSIDLGNQKVAIEKPRIRNRQTGEEIENPVYKKFQSPDIFDKNVFVSGVKKVSQRDYKNGLPDIAASFGISKSAISRSWIKTTAKKLDEWMNRSFKGPGSGGRIPGWETFPREGRAHCHGP